MYPRNNASPPRIAIGAVIQISDGAVQTSGVSVVVRAEGGAETAGGGTPSYGGSSGVVYYAPTQAETNHTAFVVTAYKTGCIPVSANVITSEASTSGQVVTDSASRTASQATGFSTPTNVSDAQTAILAKLPAALVGGRIDASVGAMATDVITAAALATDAVSEIQSGLATASNLAAIAGYLDTEIASILEDTGTTIPAQITALNNLSSAQVVSALGTGTWATALPWNAAWDAEVQSECTDALAAYDPPTKAELDSAVSPLATSSALATVDTVVDSILVEVGKVPRASAAVAAGAFVMTISGGQDATVTYSEPA